MNVKAKIESLQDDIWNWSKQFDPELRHLLGDSVDSLPPFSMQRKQERATFASRIGLRLDNLLEQSMSGLDEVFLRALRFRLRLEEELPKFHELEFDITPYRLSFNLSAYHNILRSQTFTCSEDVDRYDSLVNDYCNAVDHIRVKLQSQASKNIFPPRTVGHGLRGRIEEVANQAKESVSNPAYRAIGNSSIESRLLGALIESHRERIDKVYEELVKSLDDEYWSRAPASVGLGQYKNGEEYYEFLIRYYSTSKLSPQQIHDYGQQQVDCISQELEAALDDIGVKKLSDFEKVVRGDGRYYANSVDEVSQRYSSLIAKVSPHLREWFYELPSAPFAATRLDPCDEPGMTFGYYQMPTGSDPCGYYRFNASDLQDRSLLTSASLIYHELVPGHHLQIASQLEKMGHHPLRRFQFFNGHTEGWAEYAADLVDEVGLYNDPLDRIGRLLMKQFFACRLVVDTGLNVLGWSLNRSKKFMKQYLLMSDTEINSELIRYSTDIPAQCLSHGLGYREFINVRRASEESLGADFSLCEFHRQVFSLGSLPLDHLNASMSKWNSNQSDKYTTIHADH